MDVAGIGGIEMMAVDVGSHIPHYDCLENLGNRAGSTGSALLRVLMVALMESHIWGTVCRLQRRVSWMIAYTTDTP